LPGVDNISKSKINILILKHLLLDVPCNILMLVMGLVLNPFRITAFYEMYYSGAFVMMMNPVVQFSSNHKLKAIDQEIKNCRK
jgi:hypothetical protein